MAQSLVATGRAALERNIMASRADATRRAYGSAWNAFSAYAGPDMPADPYTVGLYLSELGSRASASTVRLHAAAIAAAHRDAGHEPPTENPGVKRALAGHARLAAPPAQATGIDQDAFEKITETAMSRRVTRGGRMEKPEEAQKRGLVDVCLIGLMRDALLRRSESAAARWADLVPEPDGSGRLTIPRSKTDQEGRGAVRYVSPEILEVLLALRVVEERDEHHSIFRLKDRQICRRIAAAAAQAGLDGKYSGHSPRIGMAQDLARAGCSLPALMQAGGWKSANMPAYYIRSIEAGTGAVAQWYESH